MLYRLCVVPYRTPMAATLNLAIWGGAAGLTTATVVSLFTRQKPEAELAGLVYGHAGNIAQHSHARWYRTPGFMAAVVAFCFLVSTYEARVARGPEHGRRPRPAPRNPTETSLAARGRTRV